MSLTVSQSKKRLIFVRDRIYWAINRLPESVKVLLAVELLILVLIAVLVSVWVIWVGSGHVDFIGR